MDKIKDIEESSTIRDILDIPNANDYENIPLTSSFNFFNINLAIVITTLTIVLGLTIALLI